jgi:uncharacterized protein
VASPEGSIQVKQYANGYVSNRVLKLNVGFLLATGPGHIHESILDIPTIRVAPDLDLQYIRGPVRLSRTKEGILVQGELQIGVEDECYRCLEPVNVNLALNVEELYNYPVSHGSEFSVSDDAILDLAPLIRAEAMIAAASGTLCKPDCKGLCPDCGANLNQTPDHSHDDDVDPRLEKLKDLLNKK